VLDIRFDGKRIDIREDTAGPRSGRDFNDEWGHGMINVQTNLLDALEKI
jgi:hypothetical protein